MEAVHTAAVPVPAVVIAAAHTPAAVPAPVEVMVAAHTPAVVPVPVAAPQEDKPMPPPVSDGRHKRIPVQLSCTGI